MPRKLQMGNIILIFALQHFLVSSELLIQFKARWKIFSKHEKNEYFYSKYANSNARLIMVESKDIALVE